MMDLSHVFRAAVGRVARAGLALGLLATVAGPAAAETLKLRLGNEGVYPPFSMVDSGGNLTGVEPDLAREVCKRLQAECEFIVMDFKALIPSLIQGKFDVLISQVVPTPERKQKMDFTRRIFYNPTVFVVPADMEFQFDKEFLKGKGVKLGIQRGSSGIKYLEDRLGDSIEYVYYDNPEQSRLDLLAGRINAMFEAKINSTLNLLQKPEGKGFKHAGGEHWVGDPNVPEIERGLSWGLAQNKPELKEKLDLVLTEIVKDCTYTKIRKAYLPITTLPEDVDCEAKTN